jgi:hypothetical protein
LPTVIDSLVVTLGLDPKAFDEGQRKAIQSLRDFEAGSRRQLQTVQGSFGSSFKSIAGFITGLETPLVLLRRHLELAVDRADRTTSSLKKVGETGAKAGEEWHEGAKAGAVGMAGLAGAALVALAAIMAVVSAIGKLKETAKDIAGTGARAAAAGLPVERLTAISAAVYKATGLVQQPETEENLAQINQLRALAERGQLNAGQAQAIGQLGINPFDAPDVVMRQMAAEFAKMKPDEAIAAGTQLGFSKNFVLALREMGPNFERLVEAAQKFAVTKEQVAAATEFNKALAEMSLQFDRLGRAIFEKVTPYLIPIIHFFSTLAEIFEAIITGHWGRAKEIVEDYANRSATEGAVPLTPEQKQRMRERGIDPDDFGTGSPEDFERWKREHRGGGAGHEVDIPRTGQFADPAVLEQYIRDKARLYGVDPDIAMKVARSEGFGRYAGDQGTSFGAFQLHIGGGLGDTFRKETGLDPSNPANEAAMIDWTLRNVPRTGWEPYHGAARSGVAHWEGIPGQHVVTLKSPDQAAPQERPDRPVDQDRAVARGRPDRTPRAAPQDDPNLLDQFRKWLWGPDFDKDQTSSPPPAPRKQAQVSPVGMIDNIRSGQTQLAMAGPVSTDNSRQVTIGDINVYTQSSDPTAVAQAVNDSIRRNLQVANASTGFVA